MTLANALTSVGQPIDKSVYYLSEKSPVSMRNSSNDEKSIIDRFIQIKRRPLMRRLGNLLSSNPNKSTEMRSIIDFTYFYTAGSMLGRTHGNAWNCPFLTLRAQSRSIIDRHLDGFMNPVSVGETVRNKA